MEVCTRVGPMNNSGNLGIWTCTRNDDEMTQILNTAANLPLILVKGSIAGMTKRMGTGTQGLRLARRHYREAVRTTGTKRSLLERTRSEARFASADLIVATP